MLHLQWVWSQIPRTCKSNKSMNLATRTIESYKKTNAERFEDQKTKAHSQGHSQVWRNEVDQRSVGSSNNSVRCWTCSHVGHIVAYCCTMRCDSCNGFGHKAQDCWNTWKQSMGSLSYSSTRKANKDEGTNAERTNAKKQVWMKKTEQLHIG